MNAKEILTSSLSLTEKEFGTLADYGYCDLFNPKQETVSQWQHRMKQSMMEEEQIGLEEGISIWEGNDQSVLYRLFNRSPK